MGMKQGLLGEEPSLNTRCRVCVCVYVREKERGLGGRSERRNLKLSRSGKKTKE